MSVGVNLEMMILEKPISTLALAIKARKNLSISL
jgi:hypothetical protein